MPGYFKNDIATAETIFGDWLHTGDIGYYSEVTRAITSHQMTLFVLL